MGFSNKAAREHEGSNEEYTRGGRPCYYAVWQLWVIGWLDDETIG